MADWLVAAAAWRVAELEDELVDEVVAGAVVAAAVEADPLDVVAAVEAESELVMVVVDELLPAEASPPWESSRPAVSARAPATLAAAAIRRPLQAGWGRRRRATDAAALVGGGGGGALRLVGASMGGSDRDAGGPA